MSSGKVLIVDDDSVNIEILNVMMENCGHHCIRASNGLEALSLLEENLDTDLIILDLVMPVMDGYQMLDELKKKPHLRNIPVIVASGADCNVLKTLQHGASDFIAKPYAHEELEVRISNLITSKRAAESSQRSKNEFVAIVSHELRTPMNGIIGMTDYLLDGEVTPSQQECLGIIRESANNLLKIINNILDFTNSEADYINLAPLPFKYVDVAEQVIRDLRENAEAKGLTLRLNVSPDVPGTVLGHMTRVSKVLTNILDNAIKFTLTGGILINLGVVRDKGADFHLFCSVSDTGIGISPETAKLIFKPFVQADGSSIRRFGGIGLGLTTSQRLVESMGGSITVSANPDSGSTFTFTFRAELPPKSADARYLDAPKDRTLSVLLAEDIHVNQLVAGRLLEKLGHRVTIANNGAEAIDKWKQGCFDLIFMDIQMPEMDGYQATRFIREEEHDKGGHIPIIALTANVLENDERSCLESGMDAYLTKPIRKESLVKVIEGFFQA
jgi:CheY-like chemotaxis protein